MQEIVGTFVGRWYVTVFGVIFLVLALRHLSAKRTAFYTALALAVGVLAENSAVRYGFPYTRYAFNPELRGLEIWVADVPLMVSLSYAFMAYFAFATARIVVSGPYSTRSRQPALEYVLAVVLATWALWIIDPITRLGKYSFLGELFQYAGPGFWFGLPLGSQTGFACTSAVMIGALTWLMRHEPAAAVPRLRNHPRLPAVGAYLGQPFFMAGTAFVVARTTNDPAVATTADALAGAVLIIAVPAVLITAVYWRSLCDNRAIVAGGVEHQSVAVD